MSGGQNPAVCLRPEVSRTHLRLHNISLDAFQIVVRVCCFFYWPMELLSRSAISSRKIHVFELTACGPLGSLVRYAVRSNQNGSLARTNRIRAEVLKNVNDQKSPCLRASIPGEPTCSAWLCRTLRRTHWIRLLWMSKVIVNTDLLSSTGQMLDARSSRQYGR